ncbi:MAG: hypothetical protein COB66_00290 [Coxiella sp. (in: Bacteria)]|nr:MAG: hypothetical protein COB66_00290 [Coxiella sp. (in: g-proteobacteria)]
MSRVGKAIRRYFIGGLLIWLPIWATYIVIKFLVLLMDGSINLLPTRYQPHALFGTDVPGIGLILTLVILLITGLLVTNFIGDRIVKAWDKLLSRIPLIRSIYSAVKQVTEALLKPSGKSFRKVLMIEFPRKGIWSIGFQTSETFPHAPGDKNHITVFVPTTPNPTSGFLMIVPEDDVVELDMSVEDGLKTIISLGVVNAGKPPANINTM